MSEQIRASIALARACDIRRVWTQPNLGPPLRVFTTRASYPYTYLGLVRRPTDTHLTQAMPNHFSRQFSPETRDSCQASAAIDALYPRPYCYRPPRREPSDGRASRPVRPWRPTRRHLAYLGAENTARDNGILATARQLRQRCRR